MPWRRAFPDLVAFGSLSTELGEVNTYLNAFKTTNKWTPILERVRSIRVSRWSYEVDLSRDLWGRMYSRHIGKLAIDLRWQLIHRFAIYSLFSEGKGSKQSGVGIHSKNNSLKIGPIQVCRAQKRPCELMVKPAVNFHIAWKGRTESLTFWSNPL